MLTVCWTNWHWHCRKSSPVTPVDSASSAVPVLSLADNAPTASRTRGVTWAFVSAACYSLTSVGGKNLLPALGVSSLLFWRFSLAALVSWVILLIWRHHGGPDPVDAPRVRLLLLGLWFGALVATGFWALQRLDASVYIVLVYTYPALVAVGSSLIGRPLRPRVWLALAVTMFGVALTVPDLFSGQGALDLAGVLGALGQAVLFAGYMIVSGQVLPRGLNGLVAVAWNLPGAALFMAPFVVVGSLTVPQSPGVRLELVIFVLVPTVGAMSAFFLAMRDISPTLVAMILTFELALVILWSWLLLGESIEPIQIAGALTVAIGVLWAQASSGDSDEPLPIPQP